MTLALSLLWGCPSSAATRGIEQPNHGDRVDHRGYLCYGEAARVYCRLQNVIDVTTWHGRIVSDMSPDMSKASPEPRSTLESSGTAICRSLAQGILRIR